MAALAVRREGAPRDVLMPRPPGGTGRGLALAVVAHVLLVAALTFSVNWHTSVPDAAEAELWAAVPQAAAPRAAAPAAPTAPPPPPPATFPPPIERIRPAPPTPERPAPAARELPDAQIGIERDRQRERRERREAEAAAQAKAEQQQQEKQNQERQQREAEEASRRTAQLAVQREKDRDKERAKQRAVAGAAADAAAQKAEQDRQARAEAKREQAANANANAKERERAKAQAAQQVAAQSADIEAKRNRQLAQIMAQAGGSSEAYTVSTANGSGKGAQNAGPSADYIGRIRGRIRPNVVFPNTLAGNPAVEIDLRLNASGRIMSSRVVKPSGSPEWDDAILRAVEKTETLPADENGRVPSALVLVYRLRD